MLFAARMGVHLPPEMDPDVRADILAREKAYSQELQKSGVWPHIWRCVGQYSNLSVFDVDDNQQLHALICRLPLFPSMRIDVTPLATRPSGVVLLEQDT